MNWPTEREQMVEQQIAARGVSDPYVLRAMRSVPREKFVPARVREFSYRDSPLPIEHDQTISQPYIVALMAEALQLEPGERVLEIGTGSGYAAAVLAELADEVYTIERYQELALLAQRRLSEAGYADRVHVQQGDGTKGWPERAPFDGIVVAAGGPRVPQSLLDQLAPGGRLVIPVGPSPYLQRLVRITRAQNGAFREENLGDVRFVPLVGEEGWDEAARRPSAAAAGPRTLPERVAAAAQPFASIDGAEVDALLERIGDARVVLVGEASHGTSEFYRMRAHITRALIERRGFDLVAVEADWPDAGRIDHYTRHLDRPASAWQAFARFPTWMWRNEEVRSFVHWLREHNATREPERRVGFYGLDLYSMYTSIDQVLQYLDERDPDAARVARERYGCLTPWQSDPAVYGHAALTGRYRACEQEVVAMLHDLMGQRMAEPPADGERFLDAVQNARLVVNAERYYRAMYYGTADSWNLRDTHMFDTLRTLLSFRGSTSRAIVWAHNSHLGDASATEMSARGEHNVGQLCRQHFGRDAYLIGCGTHTGTVAAATHWGGDMEIKRVMPSNERSYERLCHDAGVARFLLPLRGDPALREELLVPRLERAIGVIYRPDTELASHYFSAVLPRQFDEYVWFDESSAITPLKVTRQLEGAPETYPFGL